MEVLAILFFAITFLHMRNLAGEVAVLRRQYKKDLEEALKRQNGWLFHQLYSMAPGKVLKPDEVEEEGGQYEAVVVSPTEDPMSEFNGTRDDWHA